VGVLRLIASRASGRAFEVRDLLERNLLPVRWYDVDSDAESAALLETLAIPRSENVATATSARRCEGEDVIMVGGGNSAGQAAVHLSRQARSVRMVVRRDSQAQTMSRYLLNRIERAPNVEIVPNTEVAAVHGNGELEAVQPAGQR
jgi:hypothetical protein